MRNRLTWAMLLVATAFSGGCVTLCRSTPDAIPVRRLPDEVLHACPACPPSAANSNEVISTKSEKTSVVPAVESSFEFPAPCGRGSAAMFYTGGGLGSGAYPLTPDLRVTDAIAVAHGRLPPGCGRPNRVTILRRVSACQQIAIRVDLKDAMCDPRENIPIWPNDTILTPGTCFSQFFCCGPR